LLLIVTRDRKCSLRTAGHTCHVLMSPTAAPSKRASHTPIPPTPYVFASIPTVDTRAHRSAAAHLTRRRFDGLGDALVVLYAPRAIGCAPVRSRVYRYVDIVLNTNKNVAYSMSRSLLRPRTGTMAKYDGVDPRYYNERASTQVCTLATRLVVCSPTPVNRCRKLGCTPHVSQNASN
jgi:hypothetical protein